MQKTKRSLSRVLSMMLAVAMVFTLNLTSMTVKAAVSKPTATEAAELPRGLNEVTVNGKVAEVTTDNNGSETYIRYIFPRKQHLVCWKMFLLYSKTDGEEHTVLNNGTDLNGTAGEYTFNADLFNKTVTVSFDDNEYILAAGIESGNTDITAANAEAGYVSAAKFGDTDATVKKVVTGGSYPGNVYYAQQNLKWITATWQITATDIVATDLENVDLNYTIGTEAKDTKVNLKTGSVKVTLGGNDYTITGAVKGAFNASLDNFWIDFKEMRGSTTAGQIPDQTALDQATEIENAFKAYYADTTTQKQFLEGTTNMQVLQTILQWASDNGKFTKGSTTLGSNVTYVAEIDGLGEFSVGNMSGWMYTDDPSKTDATLWPTPAVGGADYVLSPNSKIAWFFTVNYMSHPW